MTMRHLIDKLKDQPATPDEHRAQQRQEWLRAIDQLFTEIEAWVAPAVDEGVLRTRRSSGPVVEQDLGEYEAPVLDIHAGGLRIHFEPVGVQVAGIIASGGRRMVGLRGRVDLICGPIRIPLVRAKDGGWTAIPLRGEPRVLDEDSFAEILGEVLLDE